MKKTVFLAAAAIALASCSSDELVNSTAGDMNGESPIAFSVEAKNITRGTKFEELQRYNFGVWAYKVKGTESQLVMSNYLVGYSDGVGTGYDNSAVKESTWDASAGDLKDHKSPWFYEKLGNLEYSYSGDKNFFKTSESVNQYQYLRYWDLAYTNTNFYAYAPYKATGVGYANGEITVENGAQTAGYDDNRKTEFLYAGAKATNANMKDVTLNFHHLGAKVNLQFYEDIPGYRVQIIDVTTTGTGIQATPATKSGTTYTKADYYTTCGATINYNDNMEPTATVSHVDNAANKTQENLKFDVPTTNLKAYTAKVTGTKYNVIPENPASDGYAKSPTTYYPVAQGDSKVGFTFHVSYKIIAEDNGEEITVHDARVYVPAKSVSGETTTYIAAWQPNTAYTYTFKITKESTGTTKPNDDDIDPTSPTIPTTKALYPIVFDGATVEEYAPTTIPETVISEKSN